MDDTETIQSVYSERLKQMDEYMGWIWDKKGKRRQILMQKQKDNETKRTAGRWMEWGISSLNRSSDNCS